MTRIISGTSISLVTLSGTSDNPVTITATGLLDAGLAAANYGNPWIITNNGTIVGSGVSLASAGTVVNAGTIAGSPAGGGAYGAGTPGVGIYIFDSGTVTNQSSGTITGYNGIFGREATVVNAGTIAANPTATSAYGVALTGDGASLINQAGGTISGFDGFTAVPNRSVTVVNDGRITGSTTAPASHFDDYGVGLYLDGSLTNRSGGFIAGYEGIFGGDSLVGLTITNAGTISGGKYAVVLGDNPANRLVIDPGAVFSGLVDGGNVAYGATMELASATAAGTLTGLGKQFFNFTHVAVDTGALWTLSGTNTVSTGITLTNAGTLSGSVTLAAGAVLSNVSSGTISGSIGPAVYGLAGATVTVVNAGAIAANPASGAGVKLGIGSVINQSSGIISGNDGILDQLDGTITNAGIIAGQATSGSGIRLVSAGTIINQTGGTISGAYGIDGRYATGPLTVTTAGVIAGSDYAVSFGHGQASRLIIDPGAVFVGQVSGGTNDRSTLELASAATAGTLTGLGAQFSNFAQLSVDAGASWTLAGPNAVSAGTTLTNAGTLLGTVLLRSGAELLNISSGMISGSGGMAVYGQAGGVSTIVNAGRIATNTTSSAGVVFGSGSITNQSGGSISGLEGILASGPTTVVNAGTVSGNAETSSGQGIQLTSGNVTNQSGASISGYDGIFSLSPEAVTVVNAGHIAGNTTVGAGIRLDAGGNVINQSDASIGGYVGIRGGSIFGLTIATAGTITGSLYAVSFGNAPANRLIIDPGAIFVGRVSGGNLLDTATLELASAATAGTLSGLGTQFLNFSQLAVDAGASWTLTGTNTIAAGATLTNAGTLIDTAALINGGIIAADTAASDGVELNSGSVTNQKGGTISGLHGILGAYPGAVTVVNAGTIAGGTASNFASGVELFSGSVTNQSGGLITGRIGIFTPQGAITVTNAGTVAGSATGIDIFSFGTITNQSSGTISGDTGIIGSEVTIVNAGMLAGNITASGNAGVRLSAFDNSVINQSGGTISGFSGIDAREAPPVTVVNDGRITGNTTNPEGRGIYMSGSLINQNGGVISGYDAIYAGLSQSALTITNAGTISGSEYAVRFGRAAANRLIIDPGAVFAGTVSGGNVTYGATMELASAATAGTVSGLATQFIDFAQLAVDAGASWTLTGTNTVATGSTLTNAGTLTLLGATLNAASVVNNGGIVLDPSTMTVASLTGTGSVTIAAGGTLEVQGTVSSGETIVFGGAGAYLHLDAPGSFAGGIVGFAAGETIDLKGVAPATASYAAGELTFGTGGSLVLATSPTVPVAAAQSSDGASLTTLCFCVGTRILTPEGERAVQDLAVGDRVTTYGGGQRPIVWIGVGTILATRGQRGAATPVIVRKGALGDNMPHRDLHVTKGHGIYVDQVLIPVEFLVNHRSVVWDDRAHEVELYHIELDAHDIMVADGAPAESFRDDGNRWLFRNASTGRDLPPLEPCAPVLTGGPIVDTAWRRILDRTGPRPWLPLTGEPDLHLLVDGMRVDCKSRSHGAYQFDLPPHATEVRVVSRACVPAEVGWARDPRLLGVAVRRILLWQGERIRRMDVTDPTLTDGFHLFEADNKFRWTNGDARLPQDWFAGGVREVGLHVTTLNQYPKPGEPEAAVA